MKVQGQGNAWTDDVSGTGSMMHNEDITQVLLADGWHKITPGSFKLRKTKSSPGVAFVTVEMLLHTIEQRNEFEPPIDRSAWIPHTVQLFPNQLHGVAYPTPTEPEGTEE